MRREIVAGERLPLVSTEAIHGRGLKHGKHGALTHVTY
jgi:hypothetical protein